MAERVRNEQSNAFKIIAQIRDAMMEVDPEEVYRGYQCGIRILW